MTTTVGAADAAHFLSLVPHLLGFVPSRSLIVVPFAGSRSLGAMRVDLPTGALGDLDSAAATIVGMVCRIPDADALTAIAYVPESAADGLPGVPVLAAVSRAADVCGVRVVDLLTVATDGWGSHLDSSCPTGGRSLDEIERAAARHPGPGPDPAIDSDHASGAVLPRRSAAERRAVGGALRSLETALAVVCGIPRVGGGRRHTRESGAEGGGVDPAALEAACELDAPPRLFERVLGGDPAELDPLVVALLVWCLSRPSLRDVALVQWATDADRGEDALEAQRRWERGEEYPERLGRIMWGDGDRPDPDRLLAALAVVREVAALAPRRLRPGPLALCAWLAWALGRSTHAASYAERALEIDPDHGLAEILMSFAQIGHLPDWAFHQRGHVR
ncbi:hypothetical protein CBF90_00050 [Microbacterium sp. AISO3]|uniref:DUF4192 family protein n=1 Tax=Microbacterium sp. AISO3 TaxID=2002831 RepID=UPI000B4D4D6A|nr:DUF4192 family protein [Microbacterium sp. AISO3]OWP23196.1 hypothetical protein CBF90_00050 [Microbacterium sp. AISO3]